MDDAKRKELEELRKKIDPDILARVANAMGQGDGGGGAAPAAPSRPAAARRPSGGAGLSELKARMKRKADAPPPAEEQPRVRSAVFVVFDNSHFRAKQLGAFIQRMGFPDVVICSDPETFMKALITSLNDANIEHLAMAIYDGLYDGMQTLLSSQAMQNVRNALPKFAETPMFVMFESDSAQDAPEGLDPRYMLSMRLSPEFSGKRVRRLLNIPE